MGKLLLARLRGGDAHHSSQVHSLIHKYIIADVNWKLVKETLCVCCMTEKAASGMKELVQLYELTSYLNYIYLCYIPSLF